MSKKTGVCFVILGAVCVLSALLLLFHNQAEDRQAGQRAAALLQEMHDVLEPEESPKAAPSGTPNGDMPVKTIDGYGYIGYVSISALELDLPVMAEWDYDRLKIAPCRQFGSVMTNDLVIAAHNYESHFGSLSALQKGAELQFTDMNGTRYRYVLQKDPETIEPDDVDRVRNSGYDLVLYTCTLDGACRSVLFFDRAAE